MVADGDESKVSPGTAVVPLEIPVETQVMGMKRFLPSVYTVGILLDPAHNERRAADDAAARKRAGYAPVMALVTGPTALPNALTRLTNSVDVLHAIPDTAVFAREHSRALLPRPLLRVARAAPAGGRQHAASCTGADARGRQPALRQSAAHPVGCGCDARGRSRVRMSAAGAAKVLRARRRAIERGRHASLGTAAA